MPRAPITIPNACTLAVLVRLCYMHIDSADQPKSQHENSPAYADALKWLVKHKLATEDVVNGRMGHSRWYGTDKGKAFIDHVLATPLPTPKRVWSIK